MGTAQLTQPYGILRQGPCEGGQELESLLQLPVRAGWLGFDTAPSYGQAEEVIGGLRPEIQIHTKISPGKTVAESLRASIDKLKRPTLDLVYLHETLTLSRDQRLQLDALFEAKPTYVTSVGASVYSLEEFELALTVKEIDVVQVPINLLDRRFSRDIVREAQSSGKKVFGRSIFLQGLLLTSPEKLPPRVSHLKNSLRLFDSIVSGFGASRVEACINFAASYSGVDGLVLGFSQLEHGLEIQRTISKSSSPRLIESLVSIPAPPPGEVDPREWT